METRASVAYKSYVEGLHYSEVECHVLLLLPRKGVTLQGHVMLPQEGVLRQEDVLPRIGVKRYVRKTCYTRMVYERLEWPVKGCNGLLLKGWNSLLLFQAGMACLLLKGWNGLFVVERLEWPVFVERLEWPVCC